MTDKPTPKDAELEALLLDTLPASKHYIRPVIEKMVAAMQAAIDKWGQPAQARAESVNQNNLENLLELIDNFAETRHTCGHWTYNLKSNEARQKVIAALKGNDLS